MFGYVTPANAALSTEERAQYRSVYCALCYGLKRYGFGAKLLLNYDFVFAAMLQMSLHSDAPVFYLSRCNSNPLQKETLIAPNDAIDAAAAALLMTSRYKLQDDIGDERFFKRIAAFFVNVLTARAYRRAKNCYPELDRTVAQCIAAQNAFEHSGNSNIDAACDATARGLQAVFTPMADNAITRRILQRLGYLLGRFVYLADAADDLADDIKYKRYNIFALRDRLHAGDDLSASLAEAKAQLRLTIGEIELCYRLLEPQHFSAVLDNIIYEGLPAAAARVGAADKGKRDVESL